ncbi:N-6 DNA methylase [Frondihabitans sp. PAMC 28766]|uniref:N-6 DNA methylase n=1 Tax=Frondihabitans sp. PAMC 28766 TaxID=1795630 RepID=UPI0012FF8597|nr:N-6 DNA methylase [Frondihabitans sp. PAMC 28766]
MCKIADEDGHAPAEELDFQWKLGESETDFLARMEDLYAKGMEEYLGVQLDKKFQSSTNFHFLDVYDEPTHVANLKILREVVELLQPYLIRYSARHQHLSDFFEMLLNTGVKQEAGQFFTPIPLVRGILQSLPIEDLIQQRVAAGSRVVAPLTIDYACGSGHFLTEAMTEISKYLQGVDPNSLQGQQRTWLTTRSQNFEWAEDAIYGIERDQRLAKVSKVAGFLNGDGQARVHQADGLGDFQTEANFTGVLRTVSSSRELMKFDLVVSNPPFAVPNFRRNLEPTPHLFRLYKNLSAESGEIECLFVERASQLLRDGGVAALILPLSVLSNTKSVYRATRRLLALDFEIVSMLELREKTFIATNTSTVCLFARRRQRKDVSKALRELQVLVNDASRAGEHEALENHGVDLVALRTALQANPDADAAYDSDILAHAVRARLDGSSDAVVAYSGESSKEQEGFLGYRFSRNRGNEGVRLIEPDDLDSSGLIYGNGSVAELIRGQFRKQAVPLADATKKHALHVPSESLWNVLDWSLRNPSAHFVEEQDPPTASPYGDFIDDLPGNLIALTDLEDAGSVTLVKGANYPKEQEVPRVTSTRILTASNLDLATRTLKLVSFRHLRSTTNLQVSMRPQKGDLLMAIASGSLRHLGKVAVAESDIDAYIGGFLLLLRTQDDVMRSVLEFNFLSARFRRFVLGLKEQNISNLTAAKLRAFPIYMPDNLEAFSTELSKRLDSGPQIPVV